MPSIRRVVEYSGLTFYEVLDLPVDLFLLMVKNHFIEGMKATQEGREYLEKCERLSTTEPDRVKVKQFGKRGGKIGQ